MAEATRLFGKWAFYGGIGAGNATKCSGDTSLDSLATFPRSYIRQIRGKLSGEGESNGDRNRGRRKCMAAIEERNPRQRRVTFGRISVENAK